MNALDQTLQPEKLIAEHLDTWSTAIKTKSSAGRGSSNKRELYGIKKLRELILELAVRGLLVPQDTNDEPVSVLLEKIAAEKARLIKEGKIKKQKVLPPIGEDERAVNIPPGWEEVRLGDVINVLNGRAYKKPEMLNEGTPILRVGNLFTSNDWYYSDLELEPEKYVDNGDLIYSWSASFGPFIWEGGKVIYHYHIWKMDFYRYDCVDKYFYRNYLDAISASIKKSGNGIAMIHMTKERMEKLVIPVPPLAEQHRIVAKVDELMALCDQLEQQTEASLSAHQTLVEVLLNTLTQAADAQAFNTAWQRIAEHFDTLFTTEHSIDQLKQCILQLAVMGKLVPQDPTDEPAKVLFKRLETNRNEWLENSCSTNAEAKTMLRKLKKLDSPIQPFPLPKTWVCVHLIQISRILVDCHNKTAPYAASGIPIIRTTNIRERKFVNTELKYVNQETYDYWSRRCPPQGGDIMFTREAPMGEALIVPQKTKWCLGQRTMLIRVMHEFVSNKYLLLALTEPHLLERASEHAVGLTVKHLRVGDVENLNIPFPPLAEQHRIVAKVDELMTLCDQLKARLTQAQTTQLQLADAITEQAIG